MGDNSRVDGAGVNKKEKPDLPLKDKPKVGISRISEESDNLGTKVAKQDDFLNDLNKKLNIKAAPALVKEKVKEDPLENQETPAPSHSAMVESEITINENANRLSKNESLTEKTTVNDNKKKDGKVKKKGLFHKMKKINLEATRKLSKSFSKST